MGDNCPLFPLLISNMLQAVAIAVKQEREIRGIQIVKLFPTEDDFLYLRDTKFPPRKFVETNCRN